MEQKYKCKKCGEITTGLPRSSPQRGDYLFVKCQCGNKEPENYGFCEKFYKIISKDQLKDGSWYSSKKYIPEYEEHVLVYWKSGNWSTIFYWAHNWSDIISPRLNGDYITHFQKLTRPDKD